MNCSKCGAAIRTGDKFCSNCGAPAGTQFCASCGAQVAAGASFCANCGQALQRTSNQPPRAAAAPPPSGGTSGESVIMDTGVFPIAYNKNLMTTINGKLTLTNNYLIFKAGHLQGVGGVAVGGIFIPNPMDANKSQEHFSIAISSITSVERGWSHVTVTSGGQKYKFGGMTKTQEWEAAINRQRGIA